MIASGPRALKCCGRDHMAVRDGAELREDLIIPSMANVNVLELDATRKLSLQNVVMGGAWLACIEGNDRGQETATNAVAAAVAAGINEWDTAPLYGNGLRETRLGAAVSNLPAADAVKVRVTTKAGRLLTDGCGGILNDYTAEVHMHCLRP